MGNAKSSVGDYFLPDPWYNPLEEDENAGVLELSWYVHDHLGNTRVTYHTDFECGEPIKYVLDHVIDYYPYGKVLREYVNGEKEKYQSTHHERDQETGLDYRGARFYDSDLGRFLSLDPYAMAYPHISAYVYVVGNPILFIDPDGRKVESHHLDKNGEVIGSIKDDGDDRTYVHAVGTTLSQIKKHNRKSKKTSGGGTLLGTSGEYQLKFSPNSNYSAGDPNDPLHANAADAITSEEFAKKYDGKDVSDIKYEGAELADSKSGGSSPRYVIDPKTGYIIDMKHFIKVGENGAWFGDLGEYTQRNKYPNSAYHPQDLFSNALGVEFFEAHEVWTYTFGGSAVIEVIGHHFPDGFAKTLSTWLKKR